MRAIVTNTNYVGMMCVYTVQTEVGSIYVGILNSHNIIIKIALLGDVRCMYLILTFFFI